MSGIPPNSPEAAAPKAIDFAVQMPKPRKNIRDPYEKHEIPKTFASTTPRATGRMEAHRAATYHHPNKENMGGGILRRLKDAVPALSGNGKHA